MLVKLISHSKTFFLLPLGEDMQFFDKAKKVQLMESFINMKYDGISDVRQHIMKMVKQYLPYSLCPKSLAQ